MRRVVRSLMDMLRQPHAPAYIRGRANSLCWRRTKDQGRRVNAGFVIGHSSFVWAESPDLKGIVLELLTRKASLALLDVGGQTLFGVGALEELLLKFALQRQRGLKRDLGAGLHRAL